MKRKSFYIITCIFMCVILLSSCKNKDTTIEAVTMNDCVAYEISRIDNIENYSDEEIKALSVVVRTNLNNIGFDKDIDKSLINDKILHLTNSTKNEILVDNSKIANIYYAKISDAKNWEKRISKSQILNFMTKNGINLSNLSSIKAEKNSDDTISSIVIGGKKISYNELQNNFDIPSNNITNIENTKSNIIFQGQTIQDKNCFYLDTIKQYKFNNYKELLSQYFDNYVLKTI